MCLIAELRIIQSITKFPFGLVTSPRMTQSLTMTLPDLKDRFKIFQVSPKTTARCPKRTWTCPLVHIDYYKIPSWCSYSIKARGQNPQLSFCARMYLKVELKICFQSPSQSNQVADVLEPSSTFVKILPLQLNRKMLSVETQRGGFYFLFKTKGGRYPFMWL